LETLLRRAELVRPEAVGRRFDPATMIAVESVRDAAHPDHTVLAELLPGWVHAPSGRLVRAAQVKVSRRPVA
jgi:molecular chaperone GrpE (heat shock protein)